MVTQTLADAGVPMTGVRIVDGSGLSLLDRLTTSALGGLLKIAWADPAVHPALLAALPVAGVNGTLEHRLLKPPARGRVLAKTGTTDNFKDAVTIAFTPDLAVGLWVGDILSNRYTMVNNSDGIFVASPAVHAFVSQALAGVPGNRWYTAPPGVIAGANNSWFLGDTPSVAKLPGDNPPSPTPSPVDYQVPPDPGGPVLASPQPSATPFVDQYGCTFPLVGPKPCH